MTISCIATGPRSDLSRGPRSETGGPRCPPLAVAELVPGEDVGRERELHGVPVERVLAEAVAAVVDDLVRGHGQLPERVRLAGLEADPAAEKRPVGLCVRADQVLREGDLVGDDW